MPKKGRIGDRYKKVKISNEKIRQRNKKEYAKIIVLAVFLLVITIGGSYALFQTTIKGNKQTEVVAGTLKVEYEDKNTISLNNASPLTDVEGLNQEPYTFTVRNIGTLNGKYTIYLEEKEGNTLDKSNIKYSIKEGEGDWSSPVLLSSGLVLKENRILEKGEEETYQIKMWLKEDATNEVQGQTYKAKVVVNVVQTNTENIVTTNPVIKLNGESVVKINQNEEYVDAGVSSVSSREEISLDKVKVRYEYNNGETTESVEKIDTSKVGIYYIYYEVEDSKGIKGISTRVVNVVKKGTNTPTIVLKGEEEISLDYKEKYVEAGYEARDVEDGELTDKVVVEGVVNSEVAGTYIIKYIVIDSEGNTASVVRKVIVNGKSQGLTATVKKEEEENISTTVTIEAETESEKAYYAVTTTDKKPGDSEYKELVNKKVSLNIVKNGRYYIFVKDSKGNVVKKTVDITNIDETKPSCSFEDGGYVEKGKTKEIELTCTDPADIATTKIETERIEVSDSEVGEVESISIGEKINKGYKYKITVRGKTSGNFTIKLKGNSVLDKVGNKNEEVESTSVKVVSMDVNTPEIELDLTGTTEKQIEISGTNIGKLSYESNNKEIAIVTEEGIVKAVSPGVTSITVTEANGKITKEVKVKVIKTITVTFTKDEKGIKSIDRTTSSCVIEDETVGCSVKLATITPETGYSEDGWYKGTEKIGTSGEEYNLEKEDTKEGKITLIAKAKANTYTIEYNANGGSGTMASQTVKYDADTTIAENTYTKTGYQFVGWTTKSDGSDDGYNWTGWTGTWKYVNGQYGISSDRLVLYARWKINNYTLTINPNGGNYNGKTTNTIVTQSYDSIYGLQVPTKTGYTFSSWTKNSEADGIIMRGNIKASANTSDLTKTIKTDTDGSEYINYTLNYKNPSAAGTYNWPFLRFANYSYVSGHTYRVSVMMRVRKAENLGYIQIRNSAFSNDWGSTGWVAKGISVNSNWVEYTMDRTFTGTKVDLYGTEYTINPCVELYTAVNGGDTGIVDLDMKNLTIYDVTSGTYVSSYGYSDYMYKYKASNDILTANYNINKYTVTYDYETNGGSSATKTSATVNYGSTIDLTPTATKTGYTFVGWNTNKTATTGLSSLTMGTSNVTLYAIYKKDVTITFNKNGAASQTNSSGTAVSDATVTRNCTMWNTATTCNITSPVITASAATPSVYGYSTAAGTHSSSWDSNTTKAVSSNATYYAQTYKSGKTITITFNKNGAASQTNSSGTAVSDATVTRSCNIATTYNGSAQATSCNITSPVITAPTATPSVYGYSTSSSTHSSSWDSNTTKAVSSNGTYYAQTYKSAVTYTAKWGSNGATLSSTANKTCTIGATYNGTSQGTSCTVTAPTITRSGFTIVGFNTNSGGTTSTLSSGGTLTLTSSNNNSTWYAISSKSVVIKWDANNATISKTQDSCTIWNTATSCNITSPTISRTNYFIIGWNTSSSSTTSAWNTSTQKAVSSSATYYAITELATAVNVTGSTRTLYRSLDAAVEASTSSSTTTTLLKNITEDVWVVTAVTANVNLNSKTMTGIFVNNNASATITLSGGTITNSSDRAIYNKGKMTINSGTYTSSTTNYTEVVWNLSGASMNINGGTISSASIVAVENNGILKINGGTLTSTSKNSLYNGISGNCTILNGILSNSIGWTIRNKGTLNMSGGVVKLTQTGTDGTALYNDVGGITNVTGGTIESTGFGFVNNSELGTDDKNKSTIRNAKISVISSSGYSAVLNRNNSYTYLIDNTIKAARAGYPILNNQGGNLVSYRDKIDELPIYGVVYRYYEFGSGNVEVAVFGRSDITSFPTWSNANGQDDLKWYSATDYSNGYGSYKFVRIYASNHNNEKGTTYTTHIYASSTYVFGFSYTMPA